MSEKDTRRHLRIIASSYLFGSTRPPRVHSSHELQVVGHPARLDGVDLMGASVVRARSSQSEIPKRDFSTRVTMLRAL